MGQFRCIILITKKLFKCLVTRPFNVLTKIRMNECLIVFCIICEVHSLIWIFFLYFKVSPSKETKVNLKYFYWQNKIHEKLKKNRSAIQDKIFENVLNLERLILFQKKLANANRFSETEQVNSWKSMSKTCLNSTNNKQKKLLWMKWIIWSNWTINISIYHQTSFLCAQVRAKSCSIKTKKTIIQSPYNNNFVHWINSINYDL